MIRAAVVGALSTIVLSFPLAALMALVYRFPIPFGGYESGPSAVPLALGAVAFYGLLGGFPVLAVLGAGGGLVAHRARPGERTGALTLALQLSAAIALAAVLTLAVLDKMIGPW